MQNANHFQVPVAKAYDQTMASAPPPKKKTEIFYFQAVNKGGEIYLF